MDNFEYSLWVFHKDFILSVVLTGFALFAASYLISAIGTSRRLHRVLDGPDPAEQERREYRHSLLVSLREETKLFLAGRKYSDLNLEEIAQIREMRQQYFSELREIGGGYGARE